MQKKRGFTLIELLVVIAIIALLLSILTPSLNAVKERAKSTVCQAHLHSWALSLALYAHNFEDKICPALAVGGTEFYQWDTLLLRYYDGSDDIRLCPKATKPDPAETSVEKVGSEKYCWWIDYTQGLNEGEGIKYGSYGFNGWAQSWTEDVWIEWQKPEDLHWGRVVNLKARLNRIPMFMDSLWKEAYPHPFNVTSGGTSDDGLPEETQEDTTWSIQGGDEINRFCLDRHNKAVNVAFLDTSVRNVDLPELWNLKWSREFIPQTERQMIADGYEGFPKWMKK